MKEIKKVEVFLFGKELIDVDQITEEASPFFLTLPGDFEYNRSWQLSFICPFCSVKVEIKEDFEKGIKSFHWIKQLSTEKFSLSFLKNICQIFNGVYLHEVSSVTYINRTGFEYDFDFQRRSSINILYSRCTCCNKLFIGDLKVGYPLYPDNNTPTGVFGKVIIEKILGIDESWLFYDEIINEISS
ncbi:hypothetical protein OO013_10985 [Mangrovivirga sp. M17]|uniref:DUF2199 domain-containing protein n=1 Tax=Mangrovivirga halotolerans TaxID=2993936 RepID=A0ABT3RRI1_9BACT|nr:hypothetical protein [Mangrovivirga halotolerans]MCX2744395.1 hypothetical protein [Mangrovivirga halotolerans]